jgi:methionyl-tRNA formyltransferase
MLTGETGLNKMTNKQNLKIAFWGTGQLAESAIYNLYKNDFDISLVITKPDSKVGRNHDLQEPMIKKWAEGKNIKVLQPIRLKMNADDNIDGYNLFKGLIADCDVCIVASYGKIIPEEILALPRFGFINIHPSDLPLLRGPSPIETQLLTGAREIVITIMKLTFKMDAGDILIKNKIPLGDTDTSSTVEIMTGQVGGQMVSDILLDYVNGHIKSIKQDESLATYCKFVAKSEGEIHGLFTDLYQAEVKEKIIEIQNKYRAYTPWPGIFFLYQGIRIKINQINLNKNISSIDELILTVTPEGKKEISWEDYKRGYIK